jgi:hypothetical protein
MTVKDPMERLAKLPEFQALSQAYAALQPLDPEGRRKVVEALHALLEISAGRNRGQDRPKKKRA